MSVAPINLTDLKRLSIEKAHQVAAEHGIENTGSMKKQDLIFHIVRRLAQNSTEVHGEGVLELMQDGGYGFLRSPLSSYHAGADDIYVPPAHIRRFQMRTGDTITGIIRPPEKGERYFALVKAEKINGDQPEKNRKKILFRDLTAEFPNEWLRLESGDGSTEDINGRIIDLFCPIGKGQRSLIVAQPKTGKTMALINMMRRLSVHFKNIKDIGNIKKPKMIALMIDERPEEVTEVRRSVDDEVEVVASTFDEPHSRHVQVAEMVIAKAKRMAEHKHDVIIFLDSLTRLARAYNTITPSSGKILTGGVDSMALQRPKRLFGAARNISQGGSITIIATALVDTGSKMDDFIYEEFKGTGNNEMHLSRTLAQKRIYPAINIDASGTRRDDLIVPPEMISRHWVLRKYLQTMDDVAGMEFLISRLRKSKTNKEFFENMKS